jgi:hypothetical protein
MSTGLSFEQIIEVIGLIVNSIQAVVLLITILLLGAQTHAMYDQTKALRNQTKTLRKQTRTLRKQTAALLLQSQEMTEQTRVFTDTIYSATFQSLYDAEAHIGELMMTYPEASRILISQTPQGAEEEKSLADVKIEPALRERVSWLGTAMLDFFEHIWTQAQKRGLPEDTWESWEEYMGKMIRETRLRLVWNAECEYYSPGFRGFVDLKLASPDVPAMPSRPRPQPENLVSPETIPPQVARVIRVVTEEPKNL